MGIPVINGLGTPVQVTTSTFTVPAPANQTNVDINFIVIAAKPWDIDFVIPIGWEKVSSNYSGVVAPVGEDTGSVRISVFRGFGRTGDVTLSATQPVSAMVAQMLSCTRDGQDGWLIEFAYGTDQVFSTNYSATGNVNYEAEADDIVFAFTAGANDSTSTLPVQSYPGLTLGSAVPLSVVPSSVGTNCLLRIDYNLVLSGTQTGVPTYSHTSADFNWGATIFMKMHSSPAEITVGPLPPFSHTAGYAGTVSNIDLYDYYFVQRVEVSGRYPAELVRGGGYVLVEGRSDIPFRDYEFHFSDKNGVPTVYRNELYLYKGGILQDVLYTQEYSPEFDRQDSPSFDYLKSPMTFLKDVNTPSLNLPVTIQDIKGYKRPGRVLGKYDVIGKRNPVVITDITGGISGEMRVLVHISPNWSHGFGTANRDFQIQELVDQGSVYYFQNVLPMFTGIPDFYFTIDDINFERVNATASPFGGYPVTVWTISFTEVDRPGYLDISVGGGIWSEIDAQNDSWLAVDLVNASWLELYQRLDVGGFSVPA